MCKIYAIFVSFQGLSLALVLERQKTGVKHQSDLFTWLET
jgi:hypothetical protein